ncbi:hypothetical protein PIB30_096559 [Stylosanthes scabra]|uniref:Uncharacterized protein n=1 Tax=Stylosanthes scabra TaxID=79078 RepID=A0ABU6ZUN6_9FABA|nr:hypothetical protein [Stylosanthes scabra]
MDLVASHKQFCSFEHLLKDSTSRILDNTGSVFNLVRVSNMSVKSHSLLSSDDSSVTAIGKSKSSWSRRHCGVFAVLKDETFGLNVSSQYTINFHKGDSDEEKSSRNDVSATLNFEEFENNQLQMFVKGDKSLLFSPNTQQSYERSSKGDTSTYPGSATPLQPTSSLHHNHGGITLISKSCFFLIRILVSCWWSGVRMGQSSAKVGAATLQNARRAMMQSRLPSLLSFVCFNVLVQSWPFISNFGSKNSLSTLHFDCVYDL